MFSFFITIVTSLSFAYIDISDPQAPTSAEGPECGLRGSLEERIQDCKNQGYKQFGESFLVSKARPTQSHRNTGVSDRIYYFPRTKTLWTGALLVPNKYEYGLAGSMTYRQAQSACKNANKVTPSTVAFSKKWSLPTRQDYSANWSEVFTEMARFEFTHAWTADAHVPFFAYYSVMGGGGLRDPFFGETRFDQEISVLCVSKP